VKLRLGRWLTVTALAIGATFAAAPAQAQDEVTFARALRLARDRAAEMKVARARTATADAQVDLARAPYLPSLYASGNATYSATQVATPGPPTATNSVAYTTALTGSGALRWTVYDFGRTSNTVSSAEAALAAASAGAADSEAALIDKVTATYLAVVYGERARDVQRSIVDQRERLMQVVKGLVSRTIAPPVDELRTQTRIEQARRDLEQIEGDLGESRAALLALLGMDPHTTTSFAAPKLGHPPVNPDAAGKEAEEHKPSVLSARAAADAQGADVSAARSRYLPSVAVTGDASYRYEKVDSFDAWLPGRSAAGGVLLTVPLYDPTNGPQLDVAKAQAAQAEATYELEKREARTDAARTAVRLGASERVVEHARKAAESSGAVVSVIRARYAQGLSSMLDVIDAESTDADARIATVRSEQARDAAAVHLLVSTGRGGRLYEGP
jgi:outer membrane protein TolC